MKKIQKLNIDYEKTCDCKESHISCITVNALREMSTNRIHVVVPVTLKDNIDVYNEAQNVLSFESFFEDYLDPAFRRWERRGII